MWTKVPDWHVIFTIHATCRQIGSLHLELMPCVPHRTWLPHIPDRVETTNKSVACALRRRNRKYYLPVQRFCIGSVLIRVLRCVVWHVYFRYSVCCCCLHLQLNLAASFHQRVQVSRFVDGRPDSQQSVVPQYKSFPIRPKRAG